MRFTRPALLAALSLLLAPIVAAQATQYTAPGGSGEGPPTREQLEMNMEQARWRLGPFRLAPWFALRSLTYEDNVFVEGEATTSDVHGSVGAGLTAYLPTGENVFWVVQALPEYLFWLDLDDRNQLIGRYGAALYADLNRLRLGFDGQISEEQRTVTSESSQQALRDLTAIHGVAEVEISAALSVVLDAARREVEYGLPDGTTRRGDLDFSNLDRDELVLGGELRYRPSEKVEMALGVETTDTDFADDRRDLSSTGTSPYLHLLLDGNRLKVDARLVRRELEPEPGSSLLPVDQTEGEARFTFDLSHRFSLGAYGSLATAYALSGDYTQFDEQRVGVDLGIPIGQRLSLRAFAESGSDDYEPLPGAAPRSDDVTAWGATVVFEIGSWLDYRAGVTQVDYDSNLPQFDRDYLRIESSLVLSTSDWVWR